MAKQSKGERYTEIRNSKALRDYFIEERFEAGVALKGSEVKSIRAGHAQMADCYALIDKGEVWLHNLHIDEYAHSGLFVHDPRRSRKLLLNRSEIRKISKALDAGGRTLVGLRMYFKEALVKVEVGLGVGKKQHDKRDAIKARVVNRELQRAMRGRK
jgi:SsrA-binding protein